MTRPKKNHSPRRRKKSARFPQQASFLVTQIKTLGPMRIFLALLALATLIFAPAAGSSPVYQGWGLVTTVLVPVLAPLVLMLFFLDALMGRVMMVDKHGTQRRRYKHIVVFNLLWALALILYWAPYYWLLGG